MNFHKILEKYIHCRVCFVLPVFLLCLSGYFMAIGEVAAQSGSRFISSGTPADDKVLVPQSRYEMQASFAPVVAKAAPAVVNVYARRIVRTRRPALFDDPFFGEFFGRRFGDRERVQNSLGSGVIVDPQGIVVTNHHVIEGGEALTVILPDRREYKAELLLADARTDLAVLRLRDTNGARFPALAFRDADSVNVGDMVLAIGNPFGVGQTVTSGIVSALARTQVGVTDFQSFIQTDAPINPGNSGGALVTLDGRLLGINTAIFTRSGGSVGIGFAIPANMVRQVVRGALSDGKITRPWLGAHLQDVSQSLAANLGLARPHGALIIRLLPASPLHQAGLKSGDVITAFAGKNILQAEDLRYRFAIREIGMELPLVYMHDGKKNTAQVKLIAAPEVPPRQTKRVDIPGPFAGITIANYNPALAEELGLDEFESGESGQPVRAVVVTALSPDNNRLNFQIGDRIEQINKTAITNVDEFIRLISRLTDKEPQILELVIRRGNRVIRAVIR